MRKDSYSQNLPKDFVLEDTENLIDNQYFILGITFIGIFC